MVFTKELCLFCLNSTLRSYRRSCETSTLFASKLNREFSSKKSNNKNIKKFTVTAKNDFVTHQLNTSIAKHLKRQQKILNLMQEENKIRNKAYDKNSSKRQDYDHDKFHRNASGHKNIQKEPSKPSTYVQSKNWKNQSKNFSKIYTIDKTVSEADLNHGELSDCDSDDYGIDELEVPNWKQINPIAITKDFYKPSEVTQSRNAEEIAEFHTKSHIKVSSNVPKLIFKFNELNDLSQQMLDTIGRQGFCECTPIQSQGIPISLSGCNLLSISQSGSGKTLAMILSAIIHILHQPPAESEDGPIGVILASTPEMAEQIRQQADDLCQEAGIKCTVLAESAHQPNNHTKQCVVGHLLIATPDCLYDSLREKLISLPRFSYFALYEANQMIDVCLEEEITQIAAQIRPECQRLIWSSSWNGDLKELAMNILNDYVRLDVGSSAVKISVAQNVKQFIKMSEEKNKKSVFHGIVDTIELQIGDRKTLVFTETPKKADKVARILLKRGFQSKSLHNGKVAMEQNHILSAFQNGDVQYLVLTDLAAKNLIFGGISNIIHFDMPISISDYALRINRTGRSDEIGNSYAILTEEDGHLADDLIGILQQTNQSIDPALFILKAANVDSDDEVSFAIPKGKGFKMYTIDNTQK